MDRYTTKLEPCPFCGGVEISTYSPTCKNTDDYNPDDRAFPVARCLSCYAEVWGSDWDQSSDQRTARAAWNTRTLPPVNGGYMRGQCNCAGDQAVAAAKAYLGEK